MTLNIPVYDPSVLGVTKVFGVITKLETSYFFCCGQGFAGRKDKALFFRWCH